MQQFKLICFLGVLVSFIFTCENSNKIDKKKAKEFSEFISPTREKAFPSFPGCEHIENLGDRLACNMQKSQEHIDKYLEYPEKLKESFKEGYVDLEYTVTTSGQIENIVVLKTFDEDCSSIAKDIVRKIPKMIPAAKDGKPIVSKNDMRVNFKVPKEEKYEITTMFSRNDFYYAIPISTPPMFGDCNNSTSKEEMEICLSKNLTDYLQATLNFPVAPKKSEKISIISFMVTKDGAIRNIDGGKLWKSAIEETIYKMPKWIPGKMNGKPVNTIFKIMHPFTEKSLKKIKPNLSKIEKLKGNPKNEKPVN
ncbi:MAG: energy transducer TonB [Saprospiraceae bacterium]